MLNKKIFIALSASAVVLCSCAKQLNYDEAKKWVQENYKSTELLKTKKKRIDFEGQAKSEMGIDYIKRSAEGLGIELDANLKGSKESDKAEEQPEITPLNGNNFEDEFPKEIQPGVAAEYKFTLNGKSLSSSFEATSTGGSVGSEISYNDNGYYYFLKEKTSIVIKEETITMSISYTYTY